MCKKNGVIKTVWYNLCCLWSDIFRCQLCASHTKCCLRTLARRWLVTSVADTSGRSPQNSSHGRKKKKDFQSTRFQELFRFNWYCLNKPPRDKSEVSDFKLSAEILYVDKDIQVGIAMWIWIYLLMFLYVIYIYLSCKTPQNFECWEIFSLFLKKNLF